MNARKILDKLTEEFHLDGPGMGAYSEFAVNGEGYTLQVVVDEDETGYTGTVKGTVDGQPCALNLQYAIRDPRLVLWPMDDGHVEMPDERFEEILNAVDESEQFQVLAHRFCEDEEDNGSGGHVYPYNPGPSGRY
jgi:hypothetical protein